MELRKILRNKEFYIGRAITWSKSVYREDNPKSVCVFNACIVTQKEGQAWYGDLDLTKDGDILKEVASIVGEPLYILTESTAINTEKKTIDVMIAEATWNTTLDIPINE